MIKKVLTKVRDGFFKSKYQFDLGMQFMVFVNFTLLIMTASDKLKIYIPLSTTKLVMIFVPLIFFCMWLFGFFLDKIVKSQHYQESESLARSPAWKKLFKRLDDIENKINENHKL